MLTIQPVWTTLLLYKGLFWGVGMEGMMPFLKGRPRYLTDGVTTGKDKFPRRRAFFFSQIRTRNHGNFLIKFYFEEVQPRAKKVDG